MVAVIAVNAATVTCLRVAASVYLAPMPQVKPHTLEMLEGLIKPYAGEVLYLGKPLDAQLHPWIS